MGWISVLIWGSFGGCNGHGMEVSRLSPPEIFLHSQLVFSVFKAASATRVKQVSVYLNLLTPALPNALGLTIQVMWTWTCRKSPVTAVTITHPAITDIKRRKLTCKSQHWEQYVNKAARSRPFHRMCPCFNCHTKSGGYTLTPVTWFIPVTESRAESVWELRHQSRSGRLSFELYLR